MKTSVFVSTAIALFLTHISLHAAESHLLWHNSTTGAIKYMEMNGMTPGEDINVVDSSNTNLVPRGIGDFTGDGQPDILLHNQNSGNLCIWKMNGEVKVDNILVLGSSNTNLKIAGVGDFDGDGDNDIATFNTNSGALRIWVMDGTVRVDNILVLTGANTNLVPRGVGDMDDDGIPDIVLRNNKSGAVRIWTMNNDFTRKGNTYITGSSNTNLELRGVVDINGDGNNDILNYNTNTGVLRAWLMDGNLKIIENVEIIQESDFDWSVRGGYFAHNGTPVADAGYDLSVQVNQTITISGSGTDSDGAIISFEWKKGTALLASTASFDYTPATAGTDTLTLTVTDDDGAAASDSMDVTVTAVPGQPPTADAGPDKNAQVNQTVTITGSGTDSDGTIVSYEWKKGTVLLASTASFDYTPATAGTDTLTLTVIDNDGVIATDSMTVTVAAVPPSDTTLPVITLNGNNPMNVLQGDTFIDPGATAEDDRDGTISVTTTGTVDTSTVGSYTLTYSATDSADNTATKTRTVNVVSLQDIPPVADAGTDQSAEIGEEVILDGSGSTDANSDDLTYQWRFIDKPEGSTAILSDDTLVNATFIVDIAGNYVVQLVVNNGTSDSAPSIVTVSVIATNSDEIVLPLITIRIEFNDHKFDSDSSVWSNKIFGNNEGELNHYYSEISYGKFQFIEAEETGGINNDGIITVSLNENHPGNSSAEFLSRLNSAVALADEYIDFSQYDTNENGAIARDELQIMFLVAGGESAVGIAPGIWAHAWCMYGGNANAPIHDGVKLMSCAGNGWYSRFGERHGSVAGGNDDATIGVIAHELGHAVFGLPDLYDTDGSSKGIGDFGLMGSGSWGYKIGVGEGAGATPTHMTGWSKIQSGFVIPTVINDTISNLQFRGTSYGDYQLYKIDTGILGEYFLLENRAPSGYDMGLSRLEGVSEFTGGLSILHIDDNKGSNIDETHKLVDVEEANNAGLDDNRNKGHINNLFFSGNADSFTPLTTPNSNQYNGNSSGLNITNISDSGDTMSADIEIGGE